VNKQVSKFCAEENSATFIVPESRWNAEFHVEVEFCQLLTGEDLLDRLQAVYESQPPTDIREKRPSKYTC